MSELPEHQLHITTTIIVNIAGTFLNNQEKRTKYLKDKELTNINVQVQQSMFRHTLEIMVTAYTRNTFSYCKEYDLNKAIVLDDYINNERIGFKVEIDLFEFKHSNHATVLEHFRELIPPEFKKYEYEIVHKFIDCLVRIKNVF